MTSRNEPVEGDEVGPGGLLGATRDHTNPDPDHAEHDGFEDDQTTPPRAIGRFVVLRRVGRGSMGEVYSAFDDELGRRVAIKLLRRLPQARESRRARMRREAQAMAKVSHPNVIQVFEAGEHGDRTFIAMEYIEGRTLEHWQRGSPGRPRSREEIVDAYLQAGAGLAAAHRAGVLHRDFKPSNVFVDADGRVKVMDFGLAAWLRRSELSGTSQPNDSGEVEAEGGIDTTETPRLTREGALLGTPAFMSPEQYLQRELDARSDQFSFCVALWEALTGMHPFGGDDLGDLRIGILKGEVREGPAARALPSTLRRALERGLAKSPGDRWPHMEALLDALRPRPRRARWPWAMAAAAALAVVGAGYGAVSRRAGLCEGAPERLARVWNDERRAAARDGLLHTDVALAEATWRRAELDLDAYAEAWAAARQRVCEATHVRGEQSPELMDQRMACLDLRLDAMAGLLGTFESAELETVLRALDASARLPDVIECETAGVGPLADAEATRPESLELRRRLVTALAHLDVGRMDDAHADLDAIHDEALVLGLPRLAAEALVKRGVAEVARGQLAQADATLEAGFWDALARDHDEAAFEAAIVQLRLVGITLGDAERGKAGITRSESLLSRLGDPPQARLDWLLTTSEVRGRHGEFREAKQGVDRALALALELHGPEHRKHAEALDAAGAVALWGGDLDEAERRFTELVALDRRLYEPDHTNVAAALNNLAIVAATRGSSEVAEQRFREVLEVRRNALGESHVAVADAYMNLAGVAYQRSRPHEALPYLEKARAIYAASMDEGSAKRNDVDIVLGMVLVDLGRTAEAEALLRDALARQRKHAGERHPDLTHTLGALGRLLTRPADAAEAVELLTTAIEIKREALRSAGVPFDQDRALAGLEADLASAEAVRRGEPEPGAAEPGATEPGAAEPRAPSQ